MELLSCPCFKVSSDNILFPCFAGPDKFLSTSLVTNTNYQKVHPPTITARNDFNEYFMTYDNVRSQFVKKKFKAAERRRSIHLLRASVKLRTTFPTSLISALMSLSLANKMNQYQCHTLDGRILCSKACLSFLNFVTA